MPLNSFVQAINDQLVKLVPVMKVYGVAKTVVRGQERLPGIVSAKGDIEYVGIDDKYGVQIYHKSQSINTTLRGPGYGNALSDIVNTYAMSMFIYLDRSKVNIEPEELFLYLQARLPDTMKAEPFNLITIRTTNVILNSEQVYNTEYRGHEYPLPVEKTLFQVNYTIETVLKKHCFADCPEVLKC